MEIIDEKHIRTFHNKHAAVSNVYLGSCEQQAIKMDQCLIGRKTDGGKRRGGDEVANQAR